MTSIFNDDDLVRFRIVLIGESSVGKTSLIVYQMQKQFVQNPTTTVGVDFFSADVFTFQNTKFRPQIWDSAGQEQYRSVAKGYFKNANAIILVFALDDQNSFNKLEQWVQDFKNEAAQDFVLALAGNKSDSQIIVNQQDIEEKVKRIAILINQKNIQHSFKYFQTSAKNGSNVKQMFDWVFEQTAKAYLENISTTVKEKTQNNNKKDKDDKRISITKKEKKKNGCC